MAEFKPLRRWGSCPSLNITLEVFTACIAFPFPSPFSMARLVEVNPKFSKLTKGLGSTNCPTHTQEVCVENDLSTLALFAGIGHVVVFGRLVTDQQQPMPVASGAPLELFIPTYSSMRCDLIERT
eukprot:1149666-Pelagomonas_calceolata.AAC.1